MRSPTREQDLAEKVVETYAANMKLVRALAKPTVSIASSTGSLRYSKSKSSPSTKAPKLRERKG